jgi:hypothetical protein
MKRKALIALLALGTVGGYAAGFASMSCRAKHRRAAFEDHVADVCVRAAQRAEAGEAPVAEEPAERPHRRWGRGH